MADTFHRTPGDQAAYGYRQLPGAGPAGGPELKTMVYGTFAVALGIVVGTLLADGSLRSMSPFASHQPVRAGISASAVSGRPGTQPAQAAQSIHQATGQAGSQLSVAQKPSATSTPAVSSTYGADKPTVTASVSAVNASMAKTSSLSTTASITKPTSVSQPVLTAKAPTAAKNSAVTQASISTKPSTSAITTSAQTLPVTQKHRLSRKMAARMRYITWRKLHPKHRLHGHLKAAVPAKLPAEISQPKVAYVEPKFSFEIEGSVSVANYDAATGVVDTYEGETFALDRRASQTTTISWLEYPADVHYRCDQFWNCTLFHAGVLLTNAKRTK